MIEPFLEELDRRWKPDSGKIPLRVIGSAALMLQTKHLRRTKDGDVLETQEISPEIKDKLLSLGGQRTELHERYGIYLDVVPNGLPFLPWGPKFHSCADLGGLKHFNVEVLDVVDVVVSKLKRFNANDDIDVRAMAELRHLDHKRFVERFRGAVERFSHDARADDLPKIIENFHHVERDYLGTVQTPIELPDWLE